MSATRAQDLLRQLSEIATKREYDLAQYSAVRSDDTNDDPEAESLIFNSFYNPSANQYILKITNFTTPEFRELYEIFQISITTKWSNGVAKRSEYKQMVLS